MIWFQVTSGKGPAECALAVAHLLDWLDQQARQRGFSLTVYESTVGPRPETVASALCLLELQQGGAAASSERAPREAALSDWVRGLEGTIQWVTKSPYRPHHKRKNWFVGLYTLDQLDEADPSMTDLRVERMRSSGPGGQHVNKTESAIRITHLPTQIVVVAQEERSQHRNKKLALARLALILRERRTQQEAAQRTERWAQSQAVTRGDAKLIFKGPKFALVR